MEINGFLAQNIFDHNKVNHAFFYEESYTLKRFYPYLEPCGLIMRLTPDAKITEETVAQDMAFWANHIGLLEQQPGFATNLAAQRTFAKLRCGIAGLYGYHKMYGHAETAYRQALRMYPTSVEATYRFAETLLEQRKKNEALDVLRAYIAHPLTDKSSIPFTQRFIDQLTADPPAE